MAAPQEGPPPTLAGPVAVIGLSLAAIFGAAWSVVQLGLFGTSTQSPGAPGLAVVAWALVVAAWVLGPLGGIGLLGGLIVGLNRSRSGRRALCLLLATAAGLCLTIAPWVMDRWARAEQRREIERQDEERRALAAREAVSRANRAEVERASFVQRQAEQSRRQTRLLSALLNARSSRATFVFEASYLDGTHDRFDVVALDGTTIYEWGAGRWKLIVELAPDVSKRICPELPDRCTVTKLDFSVDGHRIMVKERNSYTRNSRGDLYGVRDRFSLVLDVSAIGEDELAALETTYPGTPPSDATGERKK